MLIAMLLSSMALGDRIFLVSEGKSQARSFVETVTTEVSIPAHSVVEARYGA
jgi:hypothetical protein